MVKGDYFKLKDIVVEYDGTYCADYHKGRYEDVFNIVYGSYNGRVRLYEGEFDYKDLEPISKESAKILYGKIKC